MGLMRGFQTIKLASEFGEFHGAGLIDALQDALAEKKTKKPLFLFLNIADAHMPWKPIQKDHEWLSETPTIQYEKDNPDNLWRKIVEGKQKPDQLRVDLEQINDLYDQAVSNADANLAATLQLLKTT